MRKVLIANRGEIAVRIARALAEAEISAVAIYSEADQLAHHVRMADEAYPVGPAPAQQSYLDQERILRVAERAGCDAVHPGYGFLSENADFAEACARRGLNFIGPPAQAIRAMGQKISARQRMQAAGVPVIPGGLAHTLEQAKASARKVGYPIMLKPSGGGGGKGMRRLESEVELDSEFANATQEAERAFSDGTMYIEKCLLRPRHVEVQVLGDQHGNVVHLFERDCSIQRRHQKIIEEAPCPILNPELARAMGEVSVSGARALGYYSTGTFEYLLDEDGQFYFLEMNTRLQVEHGVTELTTGIDLVAAMLRVAQGEELGLSQSDINRRGHAMECRLYAEDPAHDFLPSPGRIEQMTLPQGPGTRTDEGAQTGDNVSGYYDPMIAKLLTWGADREQCARRMRRALAETSIEGPRTNLDFLRRVLQNDAFVTGSFDTSFVPTSLMLLLEPEPIPPERLGDMVSAAALFAHAQAGQIEAERAPRAKELSEWVRQHRRRL